MSGNSINKLVRQQLALLHNQESFKEWIIGTINKKEMSIPFTQAFPSELNALRNNPRCDAWIFNKKNKMLILIEIEYKGNAITNIAKIWYYFSKGGHVDWFIEDFIPENIFIIHFFNIHGPPKIYENAIAKFIGEQLENISLNWKIKYYSKEYCGEPGKTEQSANEIIDILKESINFIDKNGKKE